MDPQRRLADDDDLLAPSLGVSDDAMGFDRPWSPTWLVFVGALFGVVPAALLLAENFRRLGLPASRMPTLVGGVALGLLLTIVAAALHVYGLHGWYTAFDPDHKRALRLGNQVIAVVLGLAVAHRQRRRWDIYQGHGGESAPLFKYAAGAVLVGMALQMLVAFPFAWSVAR